MTAEFDESVTWSPPASEDPGIYDYPESEDEQTKVQPMPRRRHLNWEEDCKYAAVIAFCHQFPQTVADGFERKAHSRPGVKSAHWNLLRKMPNVATPGKLPELWSKLAILFVRARNLCRCVVAEIESLTAMRLSKDRAELKEMSAKLKEAGHNEGLQRSIAGKRKLLKGEARKVELLYELLDARNGRRLGLSGSRKIAL